MMKLSVYITNGLVSMMMQFANKLRLQRKSSEGTNVSFCLSGEGLDPPLFILASGGKARRNS